MLIKYNYNINDKKTILALGAESAGNFCIFHNNDITYINDFGDLLDKNNFKAFKKKLEEYLIKPDIILTDLHPLFNTTKLGEELSKKYKIKHIKIQHHHAHIFSARGEQILCTDKKQKIEEFLGVAMDGTGLGLDGNIWGGEIFKFKNKKQERIGHLENQVLIGADLAIYEPARMLIGILSKFLSKKEVFQYVKKYYNKNEFELLYNQYKQNFNCQLSSSTGRILDAVSVLLGFSENKRKYKHEATLLLEKNSTKTYNIESEIIRDENIFILSTTPLFEYLIKNINKDKKRLAATAQIYIAQGIKKIINNFKNYPVYFSGGLANNKIISSYLESMDIITNKKTPCEDNGISFGQMMYYLLTNPRN